MSKRIKILFTIPNFDTAGSGKVVYDLVNGLDKTLFEPEICCFHDQGAFMEEVRKLDVKIHVFQFAAPYRPLISLPYRILSIRRFFKKHKFDLIHSWHWSSDFTEPLAASLAGIPFIYTKKAMGWGNKAWRWRSQLSSKIIAINKDMMTEFFEPFKSKTIYIPLGVDTSYFSKQKASRRLPDGTNFASDDFVIVSVANLVPVKGIEVLLDAVRALDDPSVKAIIVGDNSSDYGQFLKENYQSASISFWNKQLDVRPFLAVSDLFVISTKNVGRKEGLPIAPLEAMAMEKIILGSRVPGVKDILEPFKDLIYNPEDALELSNKITYIRGLSENELKQREQKMRQHVLKHFTLGRCIEQHEILYKKMVK